MPASSSSSTDGAAQLEIGGFRVEREIRRAGTTIVYEAMQVELARRVVLTVLARDDPRARRFRAAAWPEHRDVASLYAVGELEGGLFIATRFVPGAVTVASRIASGDSPARWLADVRAALAATGAVHGALDDEWSLLVDRDGRVVITGFGLGPAGATAADDERALTALERAAAAREAVVARPWWRSRRGSVLVVAAMAACTGVLVVWVGGEDGAPARPPAVAPGLVALGSALGGGPVLTVDCEGARPSGRSQGCSAMQTTLPGRVVVVPRDGVVQAWHVRGARGEVAMQVIRRHGETFASIGDSAFQRVGPGLHSFRADLPVRRGDLVGLELAPGSAAGFRRAVRGATTTRFLAALRFDKPRVPNPPPASGRDEELLLRVDYAPGQSDALPKRLTGAAAAAAPAGRRIGEREIDIGGGREVTAAVVALGRSVVVDVFRGVRRSARIALPGADPAGRLLVLTPLGEPDLTLAWRNPDGTRIEQRYRVTASSIALLH